MDLVFEEDFEEDDLAEDPESLAPNVQNHLLQHNEEGVEYAGSEEQRDQKAQNARSDLRIESLSLRDFRSYHEIDFPQLGNLTILVGKNGIGKTNILEALALITRTQSFRSTHINQLMREGASWSKVHARISDGNRVLEEELMLEPGKKSFRVNGKAKRTSDIRGVLPAVVFTPDDLELAKKSSSVRRKALDDLGVQLTANYYIVRRDYEKVVRYKNRLLRDDAPSDMIESINETLLTCGSQLFCYRAALIERLAPLISEAYSVIATSVDKLNDPEGRVEVGEDSNEGICAPDAQNSEKLHLEYTPSWDVLAEENDKLRNSNEDKEQMSLSRDRVRETLQEALEEYRSLEQMRRRALVGPHSDSVSIFLDGRDAAAFASQGQQRSIVLAWKLAEVECVRQSMGVNPLLLLDDVMSELDSSRRDTLVRFVTEETQTVITATDLSAFNQQLLERADVIHLPLEEPLGRQSTTDKGSTALKQETKQETK